MSTSASAVKEWRSFGTLPVAAAIGYSTAVLHTYGIGAFVAPLQQEFSWSRAQISGGITIAGLVGAVMSVPIGMLVDRLGPRIVGLIGVLLMTGAFALLGTATGSTANWLSLWCVIAFANLWLQATVWTSAVGSRFEKSRGLAFAITLSGASLSAAISSAARRTARASSVASRERRRASCRERACVKACARRRSTSCCWRAACSLSPRSASSCISCRS